MTVKHHKTKNITITTNSGYQKTVTSTGASSLATVLEQMKLYGNENHLTQRQIDYHDMLVKYGHAEETQRKYQRKVPVRKPRAPELTVDQCLAFLGKPEKRKRESK